MIIPLFTANKHACSLTEQCSGSGLGNTNCQHNINIECIFLISHDEKEEYINSNICKQKTLYLFIRHWRHESIFIEKSNKCYMQNDTSKSCQASFKCDLASILSPKNAWASSIGGVKSAG